MDVSIGQRPEALALRHFGSAVLGNKLRTDRLVFCAEQILRRPDAGSLNKMMGNTANAIGLYRLLDRKPVTHAAILDSHRPVVLERMRQEPVVLLLHDTSELDYTAITSLHEELGQIGKGNRLGLLMHNTLAVTPQRAVLGLVNQVLHQRRSVPRGETAAQKRAHPGRESRLWLAGAGAVEARPPEGSLWVNVSDRGSDTLEYIAFCHRNNQHYLIRSAKNRNLSDQADPVVVDGSQQPAKLHDYARSLAVMGTRQMELPPGRDPQGRPTACRTATVGVSVAAVTLRGSRFARGEGCEDGLFKTWVVCVRELDAPEGVEPLEWILLTSVPVLTADDAWQRVDWYACRWVVEDYHKGLKSGLGIEAMQLQTRDRLEPAIALLSVIGAVLLELRHLARSDAGAATPATAIVPAIYVRVLSWHLYQRENMTMPVRQFTRDVARLGGFLGRKHDGHPGWQTLWEGWHVLHRMVEGAQAFAALVHGRPVAREGV